MSSVSLFRKWKWSIAVSNSCSPKAKAIQSRVRKQNNCPSFGNKSTSSHIPAEQATFVSIYTVQNRWVLVSVKHGLRTGDWGLGTLDCGLRTKCGLPTAVRVLCWPVVTITQYMYKREQTLSYARALWSIHLFSPLLEWGQFHVYLTAQAQNAVPRIFAFLTYQTY